MGGEEVSAMNARGAPSPINYSVAEMPAGLSILTMPLLTATPPTSVDPTGLAVSSSYDAGHVLGGNTHYPSLRRPTPPALQYPPSTQHFKGSLHGYGGIRETLLSPLPHQRPRVR